VKRHATGLATVDLGRLAGYVGYQIRQTQSAIFRDISRSIKEVGVTPGEFGLLTLLELNPGLNSASLARTYQLDKATLSLSLKSLVRRGLIQSARSTHDRRHYSLRLTAAGCKALRRATKRIERQERAMDAVLNPGERELILEILKRISFAFGR